MVTLAPSSKPRVGDSALEKIEVKLTHLKKKKNFPGRSKNGNKPSRKKEATVLNGMVFSQDIEALNNK